MQTKEERREYQRLWQRQWRAKFPERDKAKNNRFWRRNRAEWLAQHGPCQKCGSWERLEVDHKNPETKTTHNVWTWSPERAAKELKKCWVLCFICHRLKTNEERGWKMHGILQYQRGCRCKECVLRWEKRKRRILRRGKP